MQDLADVAAWEESELGKISAADIAQASREHSFDIYDLYEVYYIYTDSLSQGWIYWQLSRLQKGRQSIRRHWGPALCGKRLWKLKFLHVPCQDFLWEEIQEDHGLDVEVDL
jgi:hypothetical protein